MIDKPSSFIAPAEHLRLNCGPNAVYVVGTVVYSVLFLESLSESMYRPSLRYKPLSYWIRKN